jgi:hypothetical protein
MNLSGAGWKTYERVVAAVEAESRGLEFSITPNAKLKGAISGRSRQIDILIDLRWSEDVQHRTIVDAKLRRRKIDVKDVEGFLGMMQDCRASRGIVVCTAGYSAAALARAQEAVTIKLLDEGQEEDFPWAQYDFCLGKCADKGQSARRGLVLWDAQHPLPFRPGWLIVWTGKCDVCREFHVWCWDCGSKFAVPNEGHCDCGCEELLWASLIEEELDAAGVLNAVYLILLDKSVDPPNGIIQLDRVALR